MKAPIFRAEEVVSWVDPDEDGVMQVHVGRIISWDEQTGSRVYLIAESKDLFQLVLEEELHPVRARD